MYDNICMPKHVVMAIATAAAAAGVPAAAAGVPAAADAASTARLLLMLLLLVVLSLWPPPLPLMLLLLLLLPVLLLLLLMMTLLFSKQQCWSSNIAGAAPATVVAQLSFPSCLRTAALKSLHASPAPLQHFIRCCKTAVGCYAVDALMP